MREPTFKCEHCKKNKPESEKYPFSDDAEICNSCAEKLIKGDAL